MGEAAKAWMAAVEDPSKLVAEIERLKREVNANVEYHSFFRSKVDSALGQPRNGSGDIVSEIVGCIELLKKDRDHWRANHDNQVKLKNEVAETRFVAMTKQIGELLSENRKLKADRDHWKANHDNQVKLKAAIADRPDLGDRANRVAELVAEIERLKSDISDYEIEMRERSDVAENLARELNTERMQRKEFEALAKSLEKELDAAPKWVSVDEFDKDSKCHIVWDADEQEAYDAKIQKSTGKWLPVYCTERSLNVTHVLANLRPPVTRQWPLPDDPRGDGDFDPKVSMSANELNAIVDGWDSDDWKVVVGNDQRIVADAFDKMIEVTKSAEEDAIRERLMQPFLGSEAEKLGAMSYKLRDGERWEFSAAGQWISTKHPTWEQARKYRLATACKHEHIKTIPGTPYDVYSIECADCGKVVS